MDLGWEPALPPGPQTRWVYLMASKPAWYPPLGLTEGWSGTKGAQAWPAEAQPSKDPVMASLKPISQQPVSMSPTLRVTLSRTTQSGQWQAVS